MAGRGGQGQGDCWVSREVDLHSGLSQHAPEILLRVQGNAAWQKEYVFANGTTDEEASSRQLAGWVADLLEQAGICKTAKSHLAKNTGLTFSAASG